jgi:anti-sigma factor ChrR (cupin superfamily)
MSALSRKQCNQAGQVGLYALRTLPVSEELAVKAHLSGCTACREELERLQQIINAFVSWPTDLLRPSATLWERLAQRIGGDTYGEPLSAAVLQWSEPEWEEVARGICCKLLATDSAQQRVTMLVRMGPNVEYPPHSHAGVEELYLLHGDLSIDDRKLAAGDYNRAEPGTADRRVWSETGCTCLLITSPQDSLT